jgi:hypothetical protein
MKKSSKSYLVNTVLACGVLYWVLDLSRGERTVIDWAVIGLVVGAIVWNLVQLGLRLHEAAGGKAVWHLQRTVLFWILGLLNTALIRPGDVGTWKHWLGWVLLLLAATDTVALFLKERQSGTTDSA